MVKSESRASRMWVATLIVSITRGLTSIAWPLRTRICPSLTKRITLTCNSVDAQSRPACPLLNRSAGICKLLIICARLVTCPSLDIFTRKAWRIPRTTPLVTANSSIQTNSCHLLKNKYLQFPAISASRLSQITW